MIIPERSSSIPARLTAAGKLFDALVVQARPNTLVIAFPPGEVPPDDGAPMQNAAVELNGRWIELGGARLEAGDGTPPRRRGDPSPEVAGRRPDFKDRTSVFPPPLGPRAMRDLPRRR